MPPTGHTIVRGFAEAHRERVAALFWEAFSGKLGRVMGPEEKALRFVAGVADPAFAHSAVSADGGLLGVAGYKTADGAFVGGGFADLGKVYGLLGAAWRALPLGLLEREVAPGVLLMDGIFVEADARGAGVGSALLDAIVGEARARGLGRVRLDVIDTNPRARALYERRGFRPAGTVSASFLRPLFGFSSSTTMVLELDGRV